MIFTYNMDKPLCIQIIFYSKYPMVLFMLFWIFLVRCSSRSIFLIVSKEIQKYDQRKFYFFFRKEKFSILVFTFITEKKIAKKIFNFFFRTPKLQNKKFRKIHYFANIKYKRNSRKYCEKNLSRNIFVKRKMFGKKNSIIKIFTKKKICRKKFS